MEGTYAWAATNPLAIKFWLMSLVSLDNIPYMFGQSWQAIRYFLTYVLFLGGDNGADQPTIIKFNTESSNWEVLELQMTERRKNTATSLIDAEKVFKWCPVD